MPGSRLYIVTSPNLAASVQRASKTLSFSPLVPPILQRVAGFDRTTLDLMKGDMENGYIQQVQKAVQNRLSQGSYLDEVTLKACAEFLQRLESFGQTLSPTSTQGDRKSVDFPIWIKNIVTFATATFFYGPNNPVERDPRLADRFWDFDAGIPSLLLGIMPSVTARKAFTGREAVVKALAVYLESPQYQEAAEITRERTDIGRNFGVDTENIARSDLTFFFAGIINTSLTAFWMVLHIFARPALVTAIREELEAITVSTRDRTTEATMSIKAIVKSCPLLHAVFKEVLRLYSDNFATRVVQSDTVLADEYFLKKGSIVQVSGGIIHADRRIWGSDVASFRPERHLNSASKSTNEKSNTEQPASVHPAAFRAFGGGATLCPGRYFAVNEIIALVAMIITLFDISGPAGADIDIPAKEDHVLPIHVLEPSKTVHVEFRTRPKWQKGSLLLAP